MSYVSLLKNIPEILSQPTGIAAIASLGIHGAIALIVPLMPVDPQQSPVSASPKSVGILELSQADQNRLPEIPSTFPSQLALQPELPQQPQLLSPNLESQMQTTLPPLPLSASPYIQSALPSARTTPNYRVSAPNRNVSFPQRQPTDMRAPVRDSAPVREPIAPREEFKFDPSGFNAANQRFTPSTRTFNQSEITVATGSVPVERLPQVTASETPDRTNTATNSNREITQPRNDTAKVAGNETLVTRLQQHTQPKNEVALGNQSIPKLQPATPKAPELPVTKVNEQQGVIAQLNSYEVLRRQIQQSYPNSQEKPVIRETVAASKPNVQGTVLGFLVVDPDGRVLDIKFQDESISSDLKVKAREYFNTKSPKGGQQISSHPFSLRFQHDGKTAATTQEQSPAASLKPLPELRIQNQTSAPVEAITPQPSTRSEANNSSLSTTLESGQKLIQQLRQVQEERQESSPE